MASFRSLKYPSYWRSRRDVECIVNAHEFEGDDSICSAASGPQLTAGAETSSITNFLKENDVVFNDVDMLEESQDDTCLIFPEENSRDLFDCGSYDCDSTSESSDDDFSDTGLCEMLAQWVSEYNIPSTAVNGLLHILHHYHPTLPLEYRTLLHTTRAARVKDLSDGGKYSYIGITRNLQQIFNAKPDDACFNSEQLKIQINVDGLPIFKSSNLQLWPILGILKGMSCEKPFTVGAYCGCHKPGSVHEYLADFVDEIKQLQHEGIVLGGRHYTVSIHSFICDAPARSLLKQTKLHCGYNACERCVQKGKWDGRVVYPDTDAPLRTDVSFDELADESHHHGTSPLLGLGFGLVSRFCLDYMHLVCLGIMRKLLLMWMRGPLQYRVSAGLLQQISENLIRLRGAIPYEFARKPRSLYEVDRWKATEFRQFLLYTGPVVLRGLLSEAVYKHFMLLSVSIYCCLRSDLCTHYAAFARTCLIKFVNLASKIYGQDVLVYNMHSVIHLVDDVQLYGPLDNISSFPFENHLRHMKKLIRRPTMPLQQLMCRLSEVDVQKSSTRQAPHNLVSKQHDNGPVPDSMKHSISLAQYREFNGNGCKLKASFKDGMVLLVSGDIAVIKNILLAEGNVCFVYQCFMNRRALQCYPLSLSDINMYVVSKVSPRLHIASWSDIDRKCVCMPLTDGHEYAVIPFAHNE